MHGGLSKVWIQPKSAKRLFLAIPLPSLWSGTLESFEASMRRSVPKKHPPLIWTERKNFHMTIRFIGNINEACIPKLIMRIRAVAFQESVFTIPFDRISIETLNEPKMIWALFQRTREFVGLVERMTQCLEEFLEQECGGIKLHNGHDIIPHVTLARCKGEIPTSMNPYLHEPAIRNLDVERIVLHSSVTLPHGSIYTPLASFDLNAQGKGQLI